MAQTEDQKKVLEMLAEGKLTVDQTQQLLDKLGGATRRPAAEPAGADEPRRQTQGARQLRIDIEDEQGEATSVRLPLAFARAGLKLRGLLPDWAHHCVVVNGVDLSDLHGLSPDDLDDLDVTVEGKEGARVRIHAE